MLGLDFFKCVSAGFSGFQILSEFVDGLVEDLLLSLELLVGHFEVSVPGIGLLDLSVELTRSAVQLLLQLFDNILLFFAATSFCSLTFFQPIVLHLQLL